MKVYCNLWYDQIQNKVFLGDGHYRSKEEAEKGFLLGMGIIHLNIVEVDLKDLYRTEDQVKKYLSEIKCKTIKVNRINK